MAVIFPECREILRGLEVTYAWLASYSYMPL
jgi:hypothetical protein